MTLLDLFFPFFNFFILRGDYVDFTNVLPRSTTVGLWLGRHVNGCGPMDILLLFMDRCRRAEDLRLLLMPLVGGNVQLIFLSETAREVARRPQSFESQPRMLTLGRWLQLRDILALQGKRFLYLLGRPLCRSRWRVLLKFHTEAGLVSAYFKYGLSVASDLRPALMICLCNDPIELE